MLLSDWWTRSLKSHAIRLEWNKHCKHHKLCKTSFLWSVLSITHIHTHTHTHTHTHIEAVIAQPGAPLSLLSAGILPIQWKQHHVLFHRLPGLTINKNKFLSLSDSVFQLILLLGPHLMVFMFTIYELHRPRYTVYLKKKINMTDQMGTFKFCKWLNISRSVI